MIYIFVYVYIWLYDNWFCPIADDTYTFMFQYKPHDTAYISHTVLHHQMD